jgi:cell wall-associated NlpC family hydrolase
MRSFRAISAAAAAALLTVLVVGASHAATPKERIREKQAEAQQVLGEVNQLDAKFGATVEAWNGAKYELGLAQKELVTDRASLRVAEQQRRLAIQRVTKRVIALYEGDPTPSTIAILLGAKSLGDLIDELQAAHAVADADHRLAVQTTAVRDRYAKAVRTVTVTERRRADAVQQLDTERAQIGTMLAKRRQLLSSIQSEVATLQAQEARRQAELRAEAQARLAREAAARRLAEQQAQARARAAAAAAAAAAKPKPTPKPVAQPKQTPPEHTTTTAAPPPPPATTTTAPPPPATTTTVAPPAPAPAPPAAVPSPGGGHPEAATIALRYLGVPYRWGGASPAGFDCSGLVMYVYAQLGISLPHFAAAQYGYGSPVSRDQLQPGDLVFFENLNHVAIYIGGGQVVHAPTTGDVVKISNISDWGSSYVGARRI